MYYFLLIYFNNRPLHVSGRLAAHHQEDQQQLVYVMRWQPVNTTHDYSNCCLYRVDPPDNEHQAYSKHVKVYYRNKLIENSVSCWFLLYGYLTNLSQLFMLYELVFNDMRGEQ